MEMKDGSAIHYPVGGPRAPVYSLMSELGFSAAKFSDKTWTDDYGITVQIFGAGSMARVSCGPTDFGECQLSDLSGKLELMRLGA